MRSLWEDEAPAFRGDHVAFDGVDAHPRPVQRPLPVIVGGHSPAAHRRAVQHGDGWYGFALDRATTATQIESLRREAQSAGRDLDELTITISPSERLDPEVVRDFAQLGVDRLVLVPRAGLSLPDLESWVRARAPAAVGAEPFEPAS
jgi:alkanesulfonate monooxygenase SsuD/methylene tetrahydromethanopterin reductase-like flavin-dependent oxidoreductase (luciferase family)